MLSSTSFAGSKSFLTQALKSLSDSKAIILIVLSCVILLLYYPSFRWLIWLWQDDKAYSHGFLIPPITLYFVWLKRELLGRLDSKPRYLLGGLVVLLSACFLLIGRVGAIVQVEVLSLMLLLPGVILFIWGWGHLSAMALPLLYLQFMVPWTEQIIDRIHWPFQIISAELGALYLRAVGVPVFLNGIYIQLPNISLEVAEECSGIKFLTSMLAIAIPLVYITQKTWLRAGLVFSGALLITILTNALRVALIGFEGNSYGIVSHGPGHIFRGWFVAQFGIVVLFFLNWFVSKRALVNKLRLYERWRTKRPQTCNLHAQKIAALPAGLVLAFMIALGLYIYGIAIPRPVNAKQELAIFPNRIGEWRGQTSEWIKPDTFFVNPDKVLSRSYRDPAGRNVNLFIAYYESQSQDKRMISMYDEPLHDRAKVVWLGLEKHGLKEVKHGIAPINSKPHEVVFWYDFPSGDLTGRYKTKIKTITDALLYKRNSGAVVLLASQLQNSGERVMISEELQDFLKAVAPILHEYLP